ncbi:RNA polymerase sigma factor YlaC [subsurface metagenome]
MVLIIETKNNNVNHLSDEYLMEKVKSGSLDYMSELFQRYNNQILNYIYRLSGNLEDSQDLTQTVFLRLLKYRKSFNQSKSFKSWMYQVAKNVINSHYQAKKVNILHVEIPNHETDNDLSDDIQDEKLYKSIDKLSDEYKELIVLSKFQGLKYKEIAEILSTTEASIKNKIFRAFDRLRKVYFETE